MKCFKRLIFKGRRWVLFLLLCFALLIFGGWWFPQRYVSSTDLYPSDLICGYNLVSGSAWDGVDINYNDNQNGPWQCVDLVKRFYDLMGWGPIGEVGYAYNLWNVVGSDRFIKFNNETPQSDPPHWGDILVFKQESGVMDYGHVAIVTGVGYGRVYFVQQNVGCCAVDWLPIDTNNQISNTGNVSSVHYSPVQGWVRSVFNSGTPDLLVWDIKFYNPDTGEILTTLTAGKTVSIFASLHNAGDRGTDEISYSLPNSPPWGENKAYFNSFTIKWFMDGKEVGYGGHNSLAPGQVSSGANMWYFEGIPPNANYAWYPTAGSHIIKFVADVDNNIAESNESNNSYEIQVSVAAPSDGGGSAGGGGGGSISIAGLTTEILQISTNVDSIAPNKKASFEVTSYPEGTKRVLFLLDGKVKRTDKKPPFTASIKIKPGTHTITIIALDKNKNETGRTEIQVTK